MDKQELKSFIILFITNFLFFLGFNLLNILPMYLTLLNVTSSYIGIIMGIPMFMLVVITLIYMNTIDLIDKKKYLLLAFLLAVISYILYYLFYNNFKIILLTRLIQGITYGIGFTFIFSMAIDIIPSELRVGYLGMFGISGSLANAIGPFVAEYVFKTTENFRNVFLIGLILSTINIIIFSNIKYSKKYNEKHETHNPIKLDQYKGLIILSIIFGSIFSTHFSFISGYAQKINLLPVSVFFISYTLSLIILRLLLVKKINRWEKEKTIKIFFLIAIFSLLTESMLKEFRFIVFLSIVGIIYGLSHSILYPTFSSIFVEKTHEKGKATMLFILLFSLGQGAGAFLYGFVAEKIDYQFMYLISFFISFITFGYVFLSKNKKINN